MECKGLMLFTMRRGSPPSLKYPCVFTVATLFDKKKLVLDSVGSKSIIGCIRVPRDAVTLHIR